MPYILNFDETYNLSQQVSGFQSIRVAALLQSFECLSVLTQSVHNVCLLEPELTLLALDQLECLLKVLGLDQGDESRLECPRLTLWINFQD